MFRGASVIKYNVCPSGRNVLSNGERNMQIDRTASLITSDTRAHTHVQVFSAYNISID